mmetsp:Transcript_8755/g.16551  ORF Transcript_8755/g.16551 Transcript_8755/m.16551 type:complete len:201 (-) Transcript_8755:145-747(-)
MQKSHLGFQHLPPLLLSFQLERHNRLAVAIVVCTSSRPAAWREPQLKSSVHPSTVQRVLQKRRRLEALLQQQLLFGRQLILHVPHVRSSGRLLLVISISLRSRPREIVPHGFLIWLEAANVEALLSIDDLDVMISLFESGHVVNVLRLHVAKWESFCKILPRPAFVLHALAPIRNQDRIASPCMVKELLASGACQHHRRR